MKYIVMKVASPRSGLLVEIPILFPEILIHLEVATVIKCLLEEQFRGAKIEPVSAGFFSSLDLSPDMVTHGKSESLGNLASRPTDVQLLRFLDYGSIHV